MNKRVIGWARGPPGLPRAARGDQPNGRRASGSLHCPGPNDDRRKTAAGWAAAERGEREDASRPTDPMPEMGWRTTPVASLVTPTRTGCTGTARPGALQHPDCLAGSTRPGRDPAGTGRNAAGRAASALRSRISGNSSA